MIVVIPSVHRGAGYALATMLRPLCSRVVAIVGHGRPAFSHSKLYDARYVLPAPCDKWIGDATDGASEEQVAYVRRVAAVCRRESASIVWPTNDADLFAFARHRQLFQRAKTVVAAPSFSSLMRTSDKYRVYSAANEVRFPTPEAVLCRSRKELHQAIGRFSLPVIVKARWSTNSASVFFARDEAEGMALGETLLRQNRDVIVQRYVPAGNEVSLHYLIGQSGDILTTFALRKLRHLAPSLSTAVQLAEEPPEIAAGAALLRHLGLTGFCVIQLRWDPQQGTFSLMEINARFGANSRILFPLCPGLVARTLCAFLPGTAAMTVLPKSAIGSIGSSPIEDILSLWSYLLYRLMSLTHPIVAPPRARPVLLSFIRFYLRRPMIDIHTRALRTDPVAVLPYFIGLVRFLVPTARRRSLVKLIAWDNAAEAPVVGGSRVS